MGINRLEDIPTEISGLDFMRRWLDMTPSRSMASHHLMAHMVKGSTLYLIVVRVWSRKKT